MNLDQLNKELVEALKAGDKVKTSTLRLAIAAVGNKRIEVGHDLGEDEIIEVIGKEAKKRKESIEAYEKAGRDELVNKEKLELEILNKYLPSQLSEGDISTIIDEVMSEISAKGTDDFGKVIGAVMARVKGKADGKVVSSLVRAKLG